jgi:hypothetical protein
MTTLLHVLLFQNLPGNWVAHALEHDLAAEGSSIADAHQSLKRLVRAHVEFDTRHHLEPLGSFKSAPAAYWDSFARATPVSSALCGDEDPARGEPREIIAAVIHQYPAPALGHHRFLHDVYGKGVRPRAPLVPDTVSRPGA